MQLSDGDIKKFLKTGDLIIDNFDPARLQPASYDVLLGYEFLIFDKHRLEIIDPRKPVKEFLNKVTLKSEEDSFILQSNSFALGVTLDFIGVSKNFSFQITGKSSLARLGLIVHTTAGFVDPGNALNVTLELYNTNRVPIKLYPKMKIAQVIFTQLSSPAERAYGHKDLNSKYYLARGVQGSEMHQNFEIKKVAKKTRK